MQGNEGGWVRPRLGCAVLDWRWAAHCLCPCSHRSRYLCPPSCNAGTKAQCERELATLGKAIAAKEAELAGVQRRLAEVTAQQAALAGELSGKQRRLQALYDKQGRGAQVWGGAGHAFTGQLASLKCTPITSTDSCL